MRIITNFVFVFCTIMMWIEQVDASEYTPAVKDLLVELAGDTVRPFNAEAGELIWYRTTDEGRSCTSCHTESPEVVGRHKKTGKLIKPMARSVNLERLTDGTKIRKWLLRNCKWTFGRKCTNQEQGDLLMWLSGL